MQVAEVESILLPRQNKAELIYIHEPPSRIYVLLTWCGYFLLVLDFGSDIFLGILNIFWFHKIVQGKLIS